MSEPTWTYLSDAGRWTEDRLPTRAEATAKAVECASASADNSIPPDAGIARAHSAQAWAAVAAVLPVEPAPGPMVLLGTCGHARRAMRIMPGGRWLHVTHLSECDDAPVVTEEVRG